MAEAIHTTFKFRVKDATTGKHLDAHARAVNFVWNFCCETQRKAEARRIGDRRVKWPSAFDLIKLTTGCAADIGLHSDTVSAICRQFVASRDAHRKCPRFRASYGAKRALGWVPYVPRAVRLDADVVTYKGRRFRLWLSRPVEGCFVKGEFTQDARGRWYATFTCEIEASETAAIDEVGIDLGLKTFAALSDGTKIDSDRHYRRHEADLARQSRAGNKRRVRAIHAKIANSRRHHLHEQSTRIARENKLVAVGNVSAAKLAKTRMAKSVLDAGWSSFRHMLRYKLARRQAAYVEVDERYTSQVCSSCGSLPPSRPKGIADLGVRSWICDDCGVSHDRDTNAALNILRSARNVGLL